MVLFPITRIAHKYNLSYSPILALLVHKIDVNFLLPLRIITLVHPYVHLEVHTYDMYGNPLRNIETGALVGKNYFSGPADPSAFCITSYPLQNPSRVRTYDMVQTPKSSIFA